MLHEGIQLCKGTMLHEGRGDNAVQRDEAVCGDDIREEDATREDDSAGEDDAVQGIFHFLLIAPMDLMYFNLVMYSAPTMYLDSIYCRT